MQNNAHKIREFTDLIAWQESHKLVIDVYKEIQNFPPNETFALSQQMKRASVSITSNIAEGFGRKTYKEKEYFLLRGSRIINRNKKSVNIVERFELLVY